MAELVVEVVGNEVVAEITAGSVERLTAGCWRAGCRGGQGH
ncbi:MAG TPA: hypothetical protein VIM19_17645 [Actinomycetes bacterium]